MDYPLRQLYCYLTEGCNLACRHCWLAPKLDPDATRYPILPVETFETAVREAKPLGLAAVKLTGGEPLLHPRVEQFLETIRREGLKLSMETNGTLCTPALATAIARVPGAFVAVSMDGTDAATHEWVRGVPGSFARAREGIRRLVAAGIRPQIIMSLMRANADQAAAMIPLAESWGASSVKFNTLQPTARGKQLHAKDETLGISELIALGRHVEHRLAPTTKLRLVFDYPQAFRGLGRIADPGGCGVCGIKGILGLLAGGDYALCGIGEHIPEMVFGAIGRDALADVWRDNPMLLAIREGLPDRLTGICAACLMRKRCLGSCIAQNYYRSGDLFAPHWFCEEADAQGVFPASRRR